MRAHEQNQRPPQLQKKNPSQAPALFGAKRMRGLVQHRNLLEHPPQLLAPLGRVLVDAGLLAPRLDLLRRRQIGRVLGMGFSFGVAVGVSFARGRAGWDGCLCGYISVDVELEL